METYRGYTIKIEPEEYIDESPRDWDNLGTMVCFHSRYTLGDSHNYASPDDLLEDIKEDNHIILPLYLYDHSGITMSTGPFTCPWDSGQVGYIYVSYKQVRKEYGWKHITKQRREKIESYLTDEVKTYDQFLTGDVWWFSIEDDEGEPLDSCRGFYGYEHCEQEIKSVIDYHLDKEKD